MNVEDFGCAYDSARNIAVETFETKASVQQRCREFALKRGFSLRVGSNSYSKTKKEGNAKYVCKLLRGQQQLAPGSMPACPFFITIYGKNDEWKVTKIQFLHDHHKFAGFQTQTFVEGGLGLDTAVTIQRDVTFDALVDIVRREMLPSYENNWGNVTGKAITEWLRTKQHEINRQMASRIKIAIKDILQGDMEESYQKLESFLGMVVRVNRGSHFGFERDGDLFKRACLFPSSCLQAARLCKPIIGLDGTHLKGEMHKRGVYLVATTKDYNNHIVVLGLALVSVENYDNWSWFLREMVSAFEMPASDQAPLKPVFISDRQKGLLASVLEIFPDCVHRFCVRHIIGNVAKLGHSLSPAEQALVFSMARAESETEFDDVLAELRKSRAKAADYLSSIDKEHWVTYAMHEKQEKAQLDDPESPKLNYATFDEVTSNLSESANHWIGNDCRSSKPLHAFEDYMIKVVRQFAERRREAEREMGSGQSQCETDRASGVVEDLSAGNDASSDECRRFATSGVFSPLVPVYQRKLEDLLQVAKASEILPCFVDVVMVRFTQARTNGRQNHLWRAVNLEDRECTCRKWQDTRFPCVHAVQVAIRNGSHMSTLFDWEVFSVATFKKTYNVQFVPVSMTATLRRDRTLQIPAVVMQPEEMGTRGKKPGPKPSNKRKNPRVGSAANAQVALTQ